MENETAVQAVPIEDILKALDQTDSAKAALGERIRGDIAILKRLGMNDHAVKLAIGLAQKRERKAKAVPVATKKGKAA